MWTIVVNLALIASLWIFYVQISKKSYRMGIVDDPFRKPVFVLIVLSTLVCSLAIILAIFDSITEGF